MKLNAILSENIVSLDQQRDKRSEQQQQRKESLKDQVMVNIDHAVASAIDQLKRQGMSEHEAYGAVMSHISDLVMAFDMQGGMTD